MQNTKARFVVLLFLLSIITCLMWKADVKAQTDDYILETEQHWETYGVGGTCISGTHNLFVADIDGDGGLEIITGGFQYKVVNGSRISNEAPLRIWSWSGQNLTLEKSQNWEGSITCVYAADADGDDVVEIFTAGTLRNSTGSYSSLRAWHWNGEELNLKAHYEGMPVTSLFVNDVDGDGVPEIISVGRLRVGSQYSPRLCLWRLLNNNLILEDSLDLSVANVTSANSVQACDLDNDDTVEIITAGYAGDLKNSSGQLCVWQWNGQEFSLKVNERWQLVSGVYALNTVGNVQGNTLVNNVKAGDVDGDGVQEIVTGGFAYDGERINGQLKVWSWDGSTLTPEVGEEWTTDYLTEVKSITLHDVDGDGRMEIVESGTVAAEGSFAKNATTPERAQLKVWSWDGTNLTLKRSEDWVVGEGVCAWNIASGDVDGDGKVEIVTVGCMYVGDLCDPDMRIWSIPTSASPDWIFAVVGVAGLAAFSSAALFFLRKRK